MNREDFVEKVKSGYYDLEDIGTPTNNLRMMIGNAITLRDAEILHTTKNFVGTLDQINKKLFEIEEQSKSTINTLNREFHDKDQFHNLYNERQEEFKTDIKSAYDDFQDNKIEKAFELACSYGRFIGTKLIFSYFIDLLELIEDGE